MAALLKGYGLESLVDWAFQMFTDGRTSDEILLGLEQQPVVQEKFAAVFERRKLGLPPISFSDVVEYQRRAGELASYYDLPREFIDVNRMMIHDVSASELGDRIQAAAEVVATRPDVVATLQSWGMSEGDAIAYALDPDTGLPAVQRKFASAKVATRATQQGFGITEGEATNLTGLGVTEDQANQGFGMLGRFGEVTQQLAGEQDPAMARDAQLGVVAGAQGATSELEKRARKRAGVFEEGGGLAASNAGVVGAGSSSRV
jgi:hypothetical protein